MIVPVAIDPEAVLDCADDTPLERQALRRFLRLFRELAILIIETESISQSEVLAAVRRLPLSVRRLWMESLVDRRRWRRARKRWPGFAAGMAALAQLEGDAALAVLGDELAGAVDLPPGQSSHLPGTALEVVQLFFAGESVAFEAARRLRHSDLRKGTRPAELFRERFAPLAEISQHVVIVDRYAAIHERRAQLASRAGGLGIFLRFLDAFPGVREVKLYVAAGTEHDDCSLDDACAAIGAAATDTRFARSGTLTAYVLDDPRFRKLFHDRYVRFDCTRVVLGTGMDIFERPLQRLVTCTATVLGGNDLQLIKGLERDLRQSAGRVLRLPETSITDAEQPRA